MDYREMRSLASDPARVRSAAHLTLKLLGTEITEGAEEFLTRLSSYDGASELTTRQLEFFYSLREQSTRRSKVGEYSAKLLVQKAYEARFDLAHYEDEEWIEEQHGRGAAIALSNNQWRRLFALCRELHLIEDEWVAL